MRRPKGEGTVEKIGQKFRARKTISGQRVYGALRDTWAEADRDRQSLKHHARITAAASPTLSEYIKSLLLGRFGKGARAWAKQTWETNETHWRTKIRCSQLGQLQLTDITRKDIQAFIDLQTCAPTTIKRIGAVISKAMSEAVGDELITSNPSLGIRYPEVEERQNRVLGPKEAAIFTEPSSRIEAMLIVALYTGLRRSEICSIEWDDVEQMSLFVRGTKTKSSRKAIPIGEDAYAAIMMQPRRSKFVFTTESGRAVRPDNFTRDWRLWRDSKGLDKRTRLHDLRGSFVSLLLESGADIRTVQELARHASPATTLRAYARSRSDVKEAAIDGLSVMLQKTRTQNREQNETAALQNEAQKGVENKQFEGDFGVVEMKGFEPSTSAVRLSGEPAATGENSTEQRRRKAV